MNTKTEDFTNYIFKTITVAELNTLHTISEIERSQIVTILRMSIDNHFKVVATFFMSNALPPGFIIVPITSLHKTLNNVLTKLLFLF